VRGEDRSRAASRHPIVAVLREQGRTQTWLARKIGRSHAYTNRVLNGLHPAIPTFRAACAALLGVPEHELFHAISNAPTEGDIRAGAAVREGYPRPVGLSILEEAPHTKTA
jgi:hypothetical protein